MVTIVTQIIEPKAINFVPNENRVFKRAAVDNEIKKQNEARFAPIDDVELSEFAKNYTEFYENTAAKFSIKTLSDDTISSVERKDLVAFKLFKQADQPPTTDNIDTDNKVSVSELAAFVDKVDFFLNQIGILVPDSEVTFNEFAFFATALNDIYQEVESGNKDLNLKDFTAVVNKHVDAKRINTFEKVLTAVIDIVDVTDDVERPVVFNAYI